MSIGKVYIHVNSISHYRTPFYNIISDRSESLHIDFCKKNNELGLKNKITTKKCACFSLFSLLKIPMLSINKIFTSDFIIFEFNPKKVVVFILSPILIMFGKKVYFWGIGSRELGFKSYLMSFLSLLSSGVIVYELQSKKTLDKAIFKSKNISVIHNTVSSLKFDREKKANNGLRVIFVGTLNKRKGIYQLLDSVVNLRREIDIKLDVIGDGEELQNIKDFVSSSQSENFINIVGRLNGTKELHKYYRKADLSCSPTQAGLSVLQSFSFGVPFLTHINAITGGEVENVVEGHTGWLFDDDLTKKLREIASDKKLLDRVSSNCYDHYWNHRTVDMMADRFCNALLK